MACITLLRHGRSRADDENVFESRYDTELTSAGRLQIQSRVQEWALDAARGYDVIVTSPLRRAVSTAEVVFHGMILNAILRSMFGIPVPVNRNGVYFRFADAGYMDAVYDEATHRWAVLRFVGN